MKTTFLTLILLAVFSVGSPYALGADAKTCKVKLDKIGSIVGRGPSSDAAFENAASACMDRMASLKHVQPGEQMPEDAGLDAIDVCANIHCG